MIGLTAGTTFAAKAAISLEQCRNGSATSPNDCIALGGGTGWVNGNVGATQGHLLEGYSIPYRSIMTGLPIGTTVTVELGYDITHGGEHAIDYLTQYDRLEPHGFFLHPAELVDPTSGVSISTNDTDTLAISKPTTLSADAGTGFDSLAAAKKVITIFGGSLVDGSFSYTQQGDPNASQSEAKVQFQFIPTSATAVLAWGGHIARGDQWDGHSASAISGSPYHMRVKTWSLGSVGNQDRSLSAGAVQVETSTTNTQPSADVTFSAELNDTATISTGGGTVTFNLWSTKSADAIPVCSGLLYSETVTVAAGSATTDGDGLPALGNVVAPSTETTYYWTADYSGDDTTEPSSSACGAESVTVTPPVIALVPAPAP